MRGMGGPLSGQSVLGVRRLCRQNNDEIWPTGERGGQMRLETTEAPPTDRPTVRPLLELLTPVHTPYSLLISHSRRVDMFKYVLSKSAFVYNI